MGVLPPGSVTVDLGNVSDLAQLGPLLQQAMGGMAGQLQQPQRSAGGGTSRGGGAGARGARGSGRTGSAGRSSAAGAGTATAASAASAPGAERSRGAGPGASRSSAGGAAGAGGGGSGGGGLEAALALVGPMVERVASDVASIVSDRMRHHLATSPQAMQPDSVAATTGQMISQVRGSGGSSGGGMVSNGSVQQQLRVRALAALA